MKTRIAAIAALASLAFAPAAYASDKFEIEFSFSPVEVATEEGAEAAYDKLEAMIEEECQPTTARERIRSNSIVTDTCITQALNDAVTKMDEPEVTRIHKERRG